jgi:hypothetical protein
MQRDAIVAGWLSAVEAVGHRARQTEAAPAGSWLIG